MLKLMQSNKIKRSLLIAAAFVVTGFAFMPRVADAAVLTQTYVRLNRMAAGQTTSFRLVFRTVGAGATSVTINFQAAWTSASGVVNATQSVSSGSCAADTGATALPGSISAAGSGTTVTISSVTALSATTNYCVDLTSATAVTVPTAGEYYPIITAGSDSTTIAVRSVTSDQVQISAVVPPTFNFALGANSDSFTADLTPGTKRLTNGITLTVNTNASTGWIAWIRNADANGLFSTAQNKNIAGTTPGTNVNVDAAASTEQYVWGVSSITQGSGAGTTSADTAYDATGGTLDGSGVDQTTRPLASSTGTANGAILNLKAAATISPVTPAATDYSDTVQIIGAGSF